MKNTHKTESFSSEPSGFSFQNDDLVTSQFSDINEIYISETHFIYKAVRYGRLWIIKGITPKYSANDTCREMLKKEFDIMMRLRHESIVQGASFEYIQGMGECIVMEYIDGVTLGEWLHANQKIRNRLRIACELIDALEFIHSHGIVHRDIKLENIIVTRLGSRIKVIDFGLSDSDDYAVFKHPAGTKGYVSPEQETSSTPDVRNDIYSLGKILDKLLPERRFAKTRNLCTGSLEKRPSDLGAFTEQLKHDFKQPKRGLFYISAAILVVVLCIAVNLLRKPSEPVPNANIQFGEILRDSIKNDTEPHPDTISVAFPNEPIVISQPQELQVAPIPSPNTNSTVQDTPPINNSRLIEDIISQGIAKIDNLWNNSAMLYLDTLTDFSNMYTDWSISNMEKILDEILASHKNEISPVELNQINERLTSRIQENYNKWNQQRLQIDAASSVERSKKPGAIK